MSPEKFFWLFIWPWVAIGLLFAAVWATDRYGEIKVICMIIAIMAIITVYLGYTQVQW